MAVTDHDRKVGFLLGLDPAKIAENRQKAEEEAAAKGIPPLSRERIKEFSAFSDEISDEEFEGSTWRSSTQSVAGRRSRAQPQLLGLNAAVTFVTRGEALTGAYSARWTAHKRDGIYAFYEHTSSSLNWKQEIPEAYGFLRARRPPPATPSGRTTVGSRRAASATGCRC
jgi:hypothetical protein